MAEMHFSDNFDDLSVRTGANAGFQFDFFCERCHDAFRSEFEPYRSARASGWLGKAAGVFGGVLGGVSDAAEGMAEAGFGRARDEAFRAAVQSAKQHFHRCARCSNYFCDRCWNTDKGLCLNCAPDAEAEIEAARTEGEVAAAREQATEEGRRRGQQKEVKRPRQLVCPECGAETKGAKFCPECGARLAQKSACPGCGHEVSAGVKFCPECGQKLG
jgi:membrane protease subunit (stomatin/prohibitin family)